MIEIDKNIANEALLELEKLQAWYYAFKEFDENTYQAHMNRAHYKFKSTVLCSLIAHSRGIGHGEATLEEQAKFLEENQALWTDLKQRQDERERMRQLANRRVEAAKKLSVKPKKSLLQKLRELF